MKSVSMVLLLFLFLVSPAFGASKMHQPEKEGATYAKLIDHSEGKKRFEDDDPHNSPGDPHRGFKDWRKDSFEKWPENVDKDKDKEKLEDREKHRTPKCEDSDKRYSLQYDVMDVKKEHDIRQQILRFFYGNEQVNNDDVVSYYLENLIVRLAKHGGLEGRPITVLPLVDQMLNASAMLGGIITVNSGLIYHLNNEEELAAVLSHELAHISQNHIYRMFDQQGKLTLPVFLGALLGGLFLASGNSDVGMAAATSAVSGFAAQSLAFSRQYEQEADRLALKTMDSACINPRGMASFFKRMKRLETQNQAPEFLVTHPLTASRMSDAILFASQYSNEGYPESSVDFGLIKMHILFAFLPVLEDKVTALKSYIVENKVPDAVAHYGLAMAYFRSEQYKKAAEELAPLLKKAPNNLIYRLLQNQIVYCSGESQKGLEAMKQMVHDYPDYFPAVTLYATVLYKSHLYKESQLVLEQLLKKHPHHPFIWNQLADTAIKARDHATHYLAKAYYLKLTGEADMAMKQLDYVLDNERVEYSKKLKIQQLLNTIQQEKNQ